MTSCARIERRLPALVDRGELGDLALYRHVRTCPRCRDRLSQYRELRRTLRGLDDEAPPAARPRDEARLVRSALAGAAGVSGAIALALALRRRAQGAH